jgi:hypothetical protein
MKSIAWVLLFFSSLALAQGPDGKDTKPSEGAIKGGSVLPGETGGRPEQRPGPEASPKGMERCFELPGTLREECIERERQAAAAGATRAPGEPPPQEPRQERQ